jgi:hypothetical protein
LLVGESVVVGIFRRRVREKRERGRGRRVDVDVQRSFTARGVRRGGCTGVTESVRRLRTRTSILCCSESR